MSGSWGKLNVGCTRTMCGILGASGAKGLPPAQEPGFAAFPQTRGLTTDACARAIACRAPWLVQHCQGDAPSRGQRPSRADQAGVMEMSKRVLVTGGAGFLGSHLCAVLLDQGCEVLCVDNFFTGSRGNVDTLLDHPQIRDHAPRRDAAALCRGRRDLQPRLPGLADPLSARSRAHDQDQRAWAPSTCSASPSG